MSNLNGKVALVTGASKGIGASVAQHLASAGATVYVNYASSKTCADATVDAIVKAGGTATVIQGDVSKPTDLAHIFSTIKEAHGHLDILVNNAGIYKFAPLAEVTAEDFHSHFNLNVLALLLASKAAVEMMPDTGGSIINISSVVGSMPAPETAIYSATKAAVDSITITLSKELGARKVRVNAINPGPIRTEGTIAGGLSDGEFNDSMTALTPLGRMGLPDDIGPVAAFLASDDARWITGQRIHASGGLTM